MLTKTFWKHVPDNDFREEIKRVLPSFPLAKLEGNGNTKILGTSGPNHLASHLNLVIQIYQGKSKNNLSIKSLRGIIEDDI